MRMGLNGASLYGAGSNVSIIDQQALARVKEQILNPNNDKTVDVSKLDLSKFNRASLGTDLYAQRTSTDTALQASKSATDFGVKLSEQFNLNVQYLNSQAAQSLLAVKENVPAAISVDIANQTVNEREVVIAAATTAETQNLNKDRRGSNPFSFYVDVENESEPEDNESLLKAINIFA